MRARLFESLKDLYFLSRLHYQCFQPDKVFNIVPQSKLVYLSIRKAGCTTIKGLIAKDLHSGGKVRNIHNRKHSGLLSIQDYGVNRFRHLLEDADTFVFTFVRNPFSRITSLYTDKLANTPIGSSDNPFLIGFRRSLGRSITRHLDPGKPIPFQDYIDFVCSTCDKRINLHWSLMSNAIPEDLIPIHHIGRLESFEIDIVPVIARMHYSDAARRELGRPRNVSVNRRTEDVRWTPSMVEKVRKAYAEDFRRFGYSVDLPDQLRCP
jgi:hypothetical protein